MTNPPQKPTAVRYGVLAFACVLSMITYLDRVCFGTIAPFVKSEFGLDDLEVGLLFGAFTLAYATFEVPTGWLGDVFGPRKTLIRIVVWWSFFTALTGLIAPAWFPDWMPTHFWIPLLGTLSIACIAMMLVRFMFGIGEAGAYPNIARAFHSWFPYQERGFAKGSVWCAGRLAGGITPFIVLVLLYETPSEADASAIVSAQRDADGIVTVVTKTPHKISSGDSISIVKTSGGPGKFDGNYIVTVTGENTFNVASPGGAGAATTHGRWITTHWRHIFWIFGVIGIVWCILFWFWFSDRPEESPMVNAAELALIKGDAVTPPPTPGSEAGTGIQAGEPKIVPVAAPTEPKADEPVRVPWGKLLGSPNLWLLCMMYFCAAYGWYFNITYLPGYLQTQFGLTRGDKWTGQWWEFSIMAGLPLLLGSAACLIGGFMTDLFIKQTGNRKWGRRLFGVLGHGVCAICYFLSIGADSPWSFVLFVAFAAFWNDITMGAAWASCIDIGKRYSGIVSGCMNTIGNLGGFVANILTGYVLRYYIGDVTQAADPEAYAAKSHDAWFVNFLIFGGVYVVAVFLWLGFDATKPVDPDDKGQ